MSNEVYSIKYINGNPTSVDVTMNTVAKREMNTFEGLAHLFRFDTLSTNWRAVISSFEPITAAVLLAVIPIVTPIIVQKLKEAGLIKEQP